MTNATSLSVSPPSPSHHPCHRRFHHPSARDSQQTPVQSRSCFLPICLPLSCSASQERSELAMVSIRRRRLMGLCSGKTSFLSPLPRFCSFGNGSSNLIQNTKPFSVHPMPSAEAEKPEEEFNFKISLGSSNASGSSMSKEQEQQIPQYPKVKRRKKHRRKHFDDQETCLMRGVYFKNMKWQAAIKVDKKQIHLGTVGSQEEAAHLYDRAAFMCGREPNFELSEEEKRELCKYKWDEFLAMTRSAINNKKTEKFAEQKRRSGVGLRRKNEHLKQTDDWEDDLGVKCDLSL